MHTALLVEACAAGRTLIFATQILTDGELATAGAAENRG